MKFDMTVIDNLGLSMYQSIPPVISELVANAWDADAERVEIAIPQGAIDSTSEIRVKDWGKGMSFLELNSEYLRIGRRRRKRPDETTLGGRKLMGRKGIGKLSVFGVCKTVELITVKDGIKNSFEMNIDAIRSSANGLYWPEHTLKHVPAEGEKNGTEVVLKNIQRRNIINIEKLMVELGRRFSILSPSFEVKVNEDKLNPLLDIVKSRLEFDEKVFEGVVVDESEGLKVSGWVGTLGTIPKNMTMGVSVQAHGKLVQEPFFFGEPAGRHFAYSYLVGEISADFLDEQEDDIIAPHRMSIDWEGNDWARLVMEWGRETILDLSKEWNVKRRTKRRKKILDKDSITEWYGNLETSEKELVDRVLDILSESEIDDDKLTELAQYISDSFDFEAYTRIADKFTAASPDELAVLVDLMKEWSVLEARGYLKILKARLGVIDALENFVNTNAYEKTIQAHLYDYPWLIHPTWVAVEKERQLAGLVKEEFPDPEGKRRVDIVCVGAAKDLYVIELKRPDVKVDKNDINQLKDYVAFLMDKVGTAPEAYDRVTGYLIAYKHKDDTRTRIEIEDLRKIGHYYMTYDEMIGRAKKMHEGLVANIQKVDAETE